MFKKNFSGYNKIWGAQKFGKHCPQTPPVAAGLYILQVRYEPHLSDKVSCSEAPRFQLQKYGMPM